MQKAKKERLNRRAAKQLSRLVLFICGEVLILLLQRLLWITFCYNPAGNCFGIINPVPNRSVFAL